MLSPPLKVVVSVGLVSSGMTFWPLPVVMKMLPSSSMEGACPAIQMPPAAPSGVFMYVSTCLRVLVS
jgi:hypothetical protein